MDKSVKKLISLVLLALFFILTQPFSFYRGEFRFYTESIIIISFFIGFLPFK
jgi:hypothetical protein